MKRRAMGGANVGISPWLSRNFARDCGKAKSLTQAAGAGAVGYRADLPHCRQDRLGPGRERGDGVPLRLAVHAVLRDSYGVPCAPRKHFLDQGAACEKLEIPPATMRAAGVKHPINEGG